MGYKKSFIESKTCADIDLQMAELKETVAKLSAASNAREIVVIGGLPQLPLCTRAATIKARWICEQAHQQM